ncbi:MAG: TonB-dependent receptor [Chitinophagaceae bacterium]|nr:TonB-dependent receptor [Chitinophagaceae bacterium]
MLRVILYISVILVPFSPVMGQECSIRLAGHVEESATGEKLIAATIRIRETGIQVVTDKKGDFIFDGLCPGKYTLVISHIGCDSIERKILLEKDLHLDLFLIGIHSDLKEVTVDARRGTRNSGFKKELSERQLEQSRGGTLGDALSKINGVTLLQTGSTISKPVIHGLHSNRILTINNGVRQEGQQWGNEHAPEIDPFIADKLVVIKGVDELRYGSDAIGGVVLVEPKALGTNANKRTEINAAFFSNNLQYVLSAVHEQSLRKNPNFRYRIQGTFKKGGNAATPYYRLNNTGSEEKNLSLTAGWKKNNFSTELFYSHFSTRIGIFTGAHIGNLTDLINAIGSDRPADIFLGEKTYQIRRPSQEVAHHLIKSKSILQKKEHRFTLQLAGQLNHRKEFDIVRNPSVTRPQMDLQIFTFSEEIIWEHPKKNNFSGMGGISLSQQVNSYSGRYFIPSYTAFSTGAFYIEKWKKHAWDLQAGVRFDDKRINTTRLKFNSDTISYKFHFTTYAASLFAGYSPDNSWQLYASLAFSSRAPHVNELLSDGIHHGTATYEKGDIGLRPEESLHTTVGIRFNHPEGKFGWDLLGYINRINHFIYQQPQPATPVLTISGAFPLITYRQTDATLRGFDASAWIKPLNNIEWVTRYSFLAARNRTTNDWLIWMPANRLSNEWTWQIPGNGSLTNKYVSLEWLHVMQQNRVPDNSVTKQDYKEPPAAYHLLHFNAGTTIQMFKKPVTIGIGIRNLLNTVYRDYLNSMRYFTDEQGINASIRLKIEL